MNPMVVWARSDLDSLLCCAALKDAGVAGGVEFVNPLDVCSGSVRLPAHAWAVNLPGADAERRIDRNSWPGPFPGCGASTALESLLNRLDQDAVKKKYRTWLGPLVQWNQRSYSKAELTDPKGEHLLAVICDPAAGLGRNHDFIVSNYFFLLDMAEHLREHTAEEILRLPDVQERVDLLRHKRSLYEDQARRTIVHKHGVLIQDLREETVLYPGHPLTRFADLPKARIGVVIGWDKQKRRIAVTLTAGLKRGPEPHLGRLLHPFGGGGDNWQGIVQVEPDMLPAVLEAVENAV